MSVKAIAAASELTGLTSRDKFVLIALANYANENNWAWPSRQTLEKWTALGRTAVSDALRSLEAQGVIEGHRRIREDGSETSKRYRLTFVGPAANPNADDDEGGGAAARGGVVATRPGGGRQAAPMNHHMNHHLTSRSKHLSTFVDERPEPETFGEEEPGGGGVENVEGSSSPNDVGSSPKSQRAARTKGNTGTSPINVDSARAKPAAADSRYLELLAAWNDNCGSLPKVTVMNKARARHFDNLVKETAAQGLVASEVLAVIAKALAQNDYYQQHRYGVENALSGGKWGKHYETGKSLGFLPATGTEAGFEEGDKVRWLIDPKTPQQGYVTGVYLGLGENGRARVECMRAGEKVIRTPSLGSLELDDAPTRG